MKLTRPMEKFQIQCTLKFIMKNICEIKLKNIKAK